ncbi:MAG TPA: hypothetical protein VFE37_26060 [Chloroflexota bacterium]|nr:hypothetical protein [Chloroflexota bacterium]
MSPRSRRDFDPSANKNLLRRQWDAPILQAAVTSRGRKLTYFGLPGPAIEDLLDWKDLLATRTGVERLRSRAPEHEEDLERHRRLLRNLLVNGISDGFQLLRGEIEDIILDGSDASGMFPMLNDHAPPARMRFLYDLVNLDFTGGVGYRDKHGESKRVRAIKKLFERQNGTGFVLLMTINVRDNLDDELTRYLHERGLRADGDSAALLDWYAARSAGEKDCKLKAVIPLFIRHVAELHLFACHAYPPVSYDGTGRNRMVHFAFDLTFEGGNFQAFSPQTTLDILRLPLMEVRSERLVFGRQHDGFDYSCCGERLRFLGPELYSALLDGRAADEGSGAAHER